MKKILLIIIALLTVFTITGCTKENNEPKEEVTPSKISIEVKKETISNTKATFIFKNTTKLEYNYGPEFALEKYNDSMWVAIPMIDEVSYITEVFTIDAESSVEETIEWKMEYGKLEPGSYRLVKNFSNEQERVTSKVEFEIK